MCNISAVSYKNKRKHAFFAYLFLLSGLAVGSCSDPDATRFETESDSSGPYVLILGTAQDGGSPQAGSHGSAAWVNQDLERLAVSLGLVDPVSDQRWIFEATPDFKKQWYFLSKQSGLLESSGGRSAPDGIFLTHAHIGHYTGLMFLGHEAMGATRLPVFAMPQMAEYLTNNGPWSQLVKYDNISIREMQPDSAFSISPRLTVTPLLVPHRQEFSEVTSFLIRGPEKSVFFLPDIDSWEEWDALGTRIEDIIAQVDYAFLDATFFSEGEIPGRDMSSFPHPKIRHSMDRFKTLASHEKAKIHFIHLNHTNPAAIPGSPERSEIEQNGFHVAKRGQRFTL